MWDKKNRQNRDTPILQNIFDTRMLLKHRRVPLRIFLKLLDRKLSTETRDQPLRCLAIFDTRKWWNTKGLPRKKFPYCETKDNRQKIVILLSSETFLIPQSFWNTIGLPYENFWNCENKIFKRKSWYSYYTKVIWYQIVCGTQSLSPTNILVLWGKKFTTENRDVPLICLKFFDTRN